jgi:hypothetical protein
VTPDAAAVEMWEWIVRESVRQTIAACTAAGDRGRFADMAACFADDGVLQLDGAEPVQGRDAIVAMMQRVVLPEARPTHAHHHVSSTYFSHVTPDEVETSTYFTVMTDCGADHWGAYRDRFVPDGERWLLASRSIRVYGFAEHSYFRPT